MDEQVTRELVEKLLEVYTIDELIERDYEDLVDFFTSIYEAGLLTIPEVTPL